MTGDRKKGDAVRITKRSTTRAPWLNLATATVLVTTALLFMASNSKASAVTPVASPAISAPPDLVAGEADGYIDLPVTLNAPGESTVTVNYATANGTASGSFQSCEEANSAFVDENGTLTFPPGVTTQNVRVPLLNCHQSLPSGFETFYLNLSANSTGSTITRATTQVDITGDSAATTTPGLYVRDAVVDANAASINVPVVLGGPSGAAQGVTVSVPYTTNDGSALAGTDYTTTSGTLTFPPGETAQNVTIPILDRAGPAPTRRFSLTLGTPTNATLADGTGIITIGASGTNPVSLPAISAPPDLVAAEADGYIDLPVTLNAPGESTVTVNYATANGTASGSFQSCEEANSAFVDENGTLTFPPGVTTQNVRVPLLNCHTATPGTFTFNLSSPVNASLAATSTSITIVQTPNVPAAPTGVTPVPGNQLAIVSFTGPLSDGGDPINSYTVTASPGGATASGPSSPITVAGLTNGTAYTFTVAATNDVGTGPTSAASSPVTPIALGVPAKLVFSSEPGGGTAATPWSTQPTVTIEDAAGNTVTSDSSPISLTMVPGTGTAGATLSGCASTTMAGIAAFAGCEIDKPGSGYKLTATDSTDSLSTTSTPFDVTAAFTPLTPARVLDTRNGTGGTTGPVKAGQTISLAVLGHGGVPASGVAAVVMNVTVTQPTAPSFVTVYPDGVTRPTASNLNFTAGETIPNLVIAPVGPDGKVDFYNAAGNAQLVADVSGWFASGSTAAGGLNPLTPARMLDTRNGTGGTTGPVKAGQTISLAVLGHGGVPASGVAAVVMNVTVTQPTAPSFVTVYPDGVTRPTASNLNFTAGETIPNLVIAPVGPDGKVDFYNAAGNAQLVADVSGWFASGSTAAGGLNPLTPARVLDTRNGTGGTTGPVKAGQTISLAVLGHGGVPASGVAAVVLNVTVTQPTAPSFVTVYPDGVTRPTASNLNFTAGETIPNLVIAPVGPDGKVDFYNAAGNAQLVADVAGWLS